MLLVKNLLRRRVSPRCGPRRWDKRDRARLGARGRGLAPVGISLVAVKKGVLTEEISLNVSGGTAAIAPVTAATAAAAKRGPLRGGSSKYIGLALRALACKMARLAAGKTNAALVLPLEGNERTSHLSGKGVSTLAQRYHFLKGARGLGPFKNLAARRIGILESKLFDKRIGGVSNASGAFNGF